MKYSITVNSNNVVNQIIKCLSDTIEYRGTIIETDLETNEIVNKYKYIDGVLVELTDEEIQASKEENKVEINKEENLIDKLILDNINMQMQIDSLIQASLGGF